LDGGTKVDCSARAAEDYNQCEFLMKKATIFIPPGIVSEAWIERRPPGNVATGT